MLKQVKKNPRVMVMDKKYLELAKVCSCSPL
uniref:Uncharacterized protein n=1 Tax=Anguilla anguilla TaxID=7936 RepID=A0A0E9Q8Y2_ANGAN